MKVNGTLIKFAHQLAPRKRFVLSPLLFFLYKSFVRVVPVKSLPRVCKAVTKTKVGYFEKSMTEVSNSTTSLQVCDMNTELIKMKFT